MAVHLSFITSRSLQCYCCDRTGVHGLLTVAGITPVRISDPCLIIPELKNLRAELGAESTTNAEVQINSWGSHTFFILSHGEL
jgi:hypothetical protein